MIFVTLGSQKFQFNRLLKQIDILKENNIINDNVFAQIGYSTYIPRNYEYSNFLDREVFDNYQQKADLVITHGGTGAIIGAIKKGKKVIAVPRLLEYDEHVDNHQVEIVKQFNDSNLIYACYDCNDLEKMIKEIEKHKFNEYISNTESIIKSIESYILLSNRK